MWDFPVAADAVLLGAPVVTFGLALSGTDAEVNTRLWLGLPCRPHDPARSGPERCAVPASRQPRVGDHLPERRAGPARPLIRL